jgi:hypothetical protein
MNLAGWGIVAVLVVGSAVVAWGWWSDRIANQRRAEALSRPPERAVPSLSPDTPHPHYLSELEAAVRPDGLPPTDLNADRRHELTGRVAGAPTFPAGWTSRAFITDPATGWCVLDDPLVLVCQEDVASVRELLGVLERAKLSGRALVVVAPDAEPEVADTLRVNMTQGTLHCLLILLADPDLRDAIAALTHGTSVPRDDLVSGFLPPTALGTCATWIADEDDSWVLPNNDPPQKPQVLL